MKNLLLILSLLLVSVSCTKEKIQTPSQDVYKKYLELKDTTQNLTIVDIDTHTGYIYDNKKDEAIIEFDDFDNGAINVLSIVVAFIFGCLITIMTIKA